MQNLIRALRFTGLFIFLFFAFRFASAQTVTVTGLIKDSKDKPVQYANVVLLKSLDSSLVKGTITDSLGKYSFENIAKGAYYITASFTGMDQISSKVFTVLDKDTIAVGVLYFNDTSARLKEVIVSAKKPLFEQKIDRMVINVKNSIINAAGSALDVLEKSPGISVNRQNNTIAINGKNGVAVMINGKINYMPMDALVQLLESTSAANIERIELITMPPSKYDAGGNGGYINIVLINNPDKGINGSYFFTAGYGQRELGAAGINFNYRNNKINLYGNYSFNHNHYIQQYRVSTTFTNAENQITSSSFSDRDAISQVHNIRAGINYQLDSATLIGAVVSGYNSRWTMDADNGTTLSKNTVPDTIISAFNHEVNEWKNIAANLNVQHTFKPGHTIFFDANYIYYRDNNPNTYSNAYFNNQKEFLFSEDLKSSKITPIHLWVFSSDYTAQLNKKITMEAGAKMALSTFTNDVGVVNLKQGSWVADSTLSANYLLKENIGAAYIAFNANPNSNISMKAGLRYEYTTSNLGSVKKDNIINRKYGEFFPAFSISDKLDGFNSINFSYNRRITRPAFTDLAPFTIFFDPKTFFLGNPALQPAIANTVQAGYAFKNYTLSLSYTHEKNTIENFYFQTQRIDTVNNILYLSASNFNLEQYLTAVFSLPFQITKWWTMQNNVTGNWRKINTTFNGGPLQLQAFDYSLNSTQRWMLPKDFSVEVTGLYSSARYVGSAKRKPMYQVDAGLQKKFGDNNVLRFTVNDLFNSGGNYRFIETLPATGAAIQQNFNFQFFACKLTYTHTFGNKALQVKAGRATGAEDELKRVHN